MVYLKEMDVETGFLDADSTQTKGLELAEKYQNADPFPHIVIDDFLPPEILRTCLKEFETGPRVLLEYDGPTERKKREFKPDVMSSAARVLFYGFNSLPFIRLIENISGITGLIPDPYFFGAGFHEIQQGGHLSVHADFNFHRALGLERRINVLIYLNEDWRSEYGGQLELWDEGMTSCRQSIDPVLNRCVIFTTTTSSYHGNPNPVAHPQNVSRKSIALYYYSSTWADTKESRLTNFQSRPGHVDAFTSRPSRIHRVVRQLTPPLVWELGRRVAGRSA